jgi:hypothetical protein
MYGTAVHLPVSGWLPDQLSYVCMHACVYIHISINGFVTRTPLLCGKNSFMIAQ